MTETVRATVLRAKREKPRRSIRRIVRILGRAELVRPGELSHSSVHRLLAREGISARPSRRDDEDGEPTGARVERRSFIAERASGSGAWGTASTCSCSSTIAGQVNGWWGGGLWLFTAANSGTAGNEVWSQAFETALSGGATQWSYQHVDNPGGGTSTAQ